MDIEERMVRNERLINEISVNVASLASSYAISTKNMEKHIDKISEIITGNGDPNKGLVVTIAKMEKALSELEKHIVKVPVGTNSFTKKLDAVIPPKVRSIIWLWAIRAIMGGLGFKYLIYENIPK